MVMSSLLQALSLRSLPLAPCRACSEFIYNKYKNEKTCDVIEVDPQGGLLLLLLLPPLLLPLLSLLLLLLLLSLSRLLLRCGRAGAVVRSAPWRQPASLAPLYPCSHVALSLVGRRWLHQGGGANGRDCGSCANHQPHLDRHLQVAGEGRPREGIRMAACNKGQSRKTQRCVWRCTAGVRGPATLRAFLRRLITRRPLRRPALPALQLALKTRNSLVLCPHPRARKCTIEAARIVRDAAVAAGAPEDIISWIEQPSLLVSQALMQSPQVLLGAGGCVLFRFEAQRCCTSLLARTGCASHLCHLHPAPLSPPPTPPPKGLPYSGHRRTADGQGRLLLRQPRPGRGRRQHGVWLAARRGPEEKGL